MRSFTVPVLVFSVSLFLVGFTLIPNRFSTPIAHDQLSAGPVLVACRMPSLGGVDRIAWWAWNPHRRTIHLASPEEGWGEIEGQHLVWSSQVEDVPSKAWQQLSGLVPIPTLVPIAPGAIAGGMFLADLPATYLDPAKLGSPTADPACPTAVSHPLIMKIGWFEKPVTGRPTSLCDYQSLVAGQSLALSNPLVGISSSPAVAGTASDGRAAGSSDRF